MLKWLKKFLKQLWAIFKKLLPFLVILCIAIFFMNPALFSLIVQTAGGWFASIGAALSGGLTWVTGLFEGLTFWESVAAVVGAAFLLDPESTTKAVTKAVGAVGDVVADVAGSVTDALADSLFSSPLFWVAAGVGIWFLVKKPDDNEKDVNLLLAKEYRSDDGNERAVIGDINNEQNSVSRMTETSSKEK